MEPELKRQYLDEVGKSLMDELKEAVEWRRTYEQRMLDAEKQVADGTVDLSKQKATKDAGGAMNPELRLHERGLDNITAAIWRTVKARISNMLFGTDEPHADIEPSPKADAAAFGIPPEQPFDATVVEKAAEAMELTIKDRLAEADYAKHGRAVIEDGTKAGTGILYGPFPKVVTRKVGTTQVLSDGKAVMMFTIEKKTVPSIERLDWRRFYPRPARCIEECEGVFMADVQTKKKFSKLKEDPTYDAEQIARIISEDPANKNASFMSDLAKSMTGQEASLTIKGKYPVFTYIGSIPDKCIKALADEDFEGEPQFVDGEIVMCQGIVIKATPRNGEERLPFHIYNYIKDPNSIFGFAVAHDIAHDQHDRNLSWASMKLNARASAFPIVGWNTELLNDANGQIDWPPIKPIDLDTDDINKAIQVMSIPSTIGDITQIYDRCGQNALSHSMVQSMDQNAPDNPQVGAQLFYMMKIENNIVTADAAVNWDDSMTKPMLQSFVEFELFNGDDPAVKGAYDVVPRAATHLLTKDIQVQQAMQLMQFADNPSNMPFYKRYNLNKIIVSRTSLPADQVLNTEEEAKAIQEQQAQQPNPEIQKLEMQLKIEELKAQSNLEIAKLKADADIQVARMGMAIEEMKASNDGVSSEAEIAAKVRMKEIDAEAKTFSESLKDAREREKTAAKTAIDAEKIAAQETKVQIELENETPFRTQ